jgi:hypothetical protein
MTYEPSDFTRRAPAQDLALPGQPSPLIIGEPQPATPELLPEDSVLLFQVVEDLQLSPIGPADQNQQ